jgi:hypothetical protein
MKMDVLPAAINALPDAGLFGANRHWRIVSVEALHKPDVGNHRGVVAKHSHLRRGHRGGARLRTSAKVKVELVERHPLDQLTAGFRLEAGQFRVAQFLICAPVRSRNTVQQPLVEFQQFRSHLLIGHENALERQQAHSELVFFWEET